MAALRQLIPIRANDVVRLKAVPTTGAAHLVSSTLQLTVPTSFSSFSTAAKLFQSSTWSTPWSMWSLLLLSSTAGIAAEKTNIGAMLSSPLVTMAITLTMCNIGMLPSSSPVYDIVLKYFVPLAVPLLLLDADLRKCFKSMKQLLKAFMVGALGTFLGTILAYTLVPMRTISKSADVAAALCSRHIGGAVNFIAISEITKIPAEIITAAIAADNVVVAIYFAFLFTVSIPDKRSAAEMVASSPSRNSFSLVPPPEPAKCPFPIFSRLGKENETESTEDPEVPAKDALAKIVTVNTTPNIEVSRESAGGITIERLLGALSLSFVICTVSQAVAMTMSWSAILVSSFIAITAATFLPNVVHPLSKSGGVIGVAFMQVNKVM